MTEIEMTFNQLKTNTGVADFESSHCII